MKLHLGDCLEYIKTLEDSTIGAVVTDPPYGLKFMGKGWDSPDNLVFTEEYWKEVLRVMKPGAHILAFSGSRTYHWLAVAIEKAGFEIRDQIMWIYGSGFPKNHNISKGIDKKEGLSYEAEQWNGWGTSLKPAHEPLVLARKPLEKGLTVANNVLKWGVGGINIDECRIPYDMTDKSPATNPLYRQQNKEKFKQIKGAISFTSGKNGVSESGRFPANIILDGSDEVISKFPLTKKGGAIRKDYQINNNVYGDMSMLTSNHTEGYGDSGSASRFFYCAKASKKDRSEGLEDFEGNGGIRSNDPRGNEDIKTPVRKNNHPTVKPTQLMEYLIKLITPKGETVLDPFMGSGSTGKALFRLNKENDFDYKFVGCEKDKDYFKIAKARIDSEINKKVRN